MAAKIHKNGEKDITCYVKEWMFKSFKDETFQQLQKDYESGLLKKYEDPYFPPNNDSLGQKIVKKFKDLIWRRAPEFIEKVEVLNLDVEQKVNQGRIGDCYLLNPIGLLGLMQKNMISRLFTIKEPNAFGYYSVWLFIDGKWQYIPVDECFPWWITRKKPYFCDIVNETQIWPMIIEKAWAKLHGEYSRLWGGDTGLAFRVITGAPTKSYGLKKYRKDPRKKEYVYKQIEYHLSQGHLISVTTGALDDYGKSIMTQGHSYALIGYKKEENKYIIRDPRGPTNVFGKEIYEIDQTELIYLFQCVIVCLLHPDYVFTQHELFKEDDQQSKSEKLFKMKVEKKMKFHLSFYQPNKRFFKTSEKKQKHKLSKITVKVLKIDSKDGSITKAKTISQRNGKLQQMDLEVNLTKGSYYIYVLAEWNTLEHRKINVCSYGQYYVEFADLPSDKKLNQLKEFLEVQRLKKEEQKKNKKTNKQKTSNVQTKTNNEIENKINSNTKLTLNDDKNQNNKHENTNKKDEKSIKSSVKQQNNEQQDISNETADITQQSKNENNNQQKQQSQIDTDNSVLLQQSNNQSTNNTTNQLALSKRNQTKSKTFIGQARYSLSRSQTKSSQQPQQDPNDISETNGRSQIKTQQQVKQKSIQQLDGNEGVYNPSNHRIKSKQKPQSLVITERRSIRVSLQSISAAANSLVQKADNLTNIQQTEIISQNNQLKQREHLKSETKQISKEQNAQKLLPPICPSPQMKSNNVNTYHNSKYLSQTDQKVNPKMQIQNQMIENKQSSIIAAATSSLIVWAQNSSQMEHQSNQQVINQKSKITERNTPFKNANTTVLNNVNLFNQLTDFKQGNVLPLREKQNQSYNAFSYRNNKQPNGNQFSQIKLLQMQRVNV